MRLTNKSVLNYSRISCIDFSNHDSSMCRNGGSYAEGLILHNNGDDTFTVVPYTSGEYCPKCGSWDCCGDCYEDEIISSIKALFVINAYLKDASCEVEFERGA